jgi:hypothetical protein
MIQVLGAFFFNTVWGKALAIAAGALSVWLWRHDTRVAAQARSGPCEALNLTAAHHEAGLELRDPLLEQPAHDPLVLARLQFQVPEEESAAHLLDRLDGVLRRALAE